MARRHCRYLALHFYLAQQAPRSSNEIVTIMENAIKKAASLSNLSDVEQLLLQAPVVHQRFPQCLDQHVYYIHLSWKHHGYDMTHGSTILYEVDSQMHVGLVELLIEIAGLYLIFGN